MSPYDRFQLVILGLVLVVFVGRSLWLGAQGVRVFAIGRGKRGLARALELSFFVLLPPWIAELTFGAVTGGGSLLPGALGERLFAHPLPRTAGALLCTFGLGMLAAALVAFGRSWRIGIDREAPGGLVTSGVFTRSRNPVFVAFDAWFVGTALLAPSPFFVGAAVLMVAGVHRQILEEERFLASRYGEAYHHYVGRVRRYV